MLHLAGLEKLEAWMSLVLALEVQIFFSHVKSQICMAGSLGSDRGPKSPH